MAEWKPKVRRVSGTEQAQMRKVAGLLRDRRIDEAEVELKAVLRENPKSFAANLGMGRLLQTRRQYDRSIEFLERARKSDPARSEAAYFVGVSYMQQGETAKAIEAFKAAIAADPKSAQAYGSLAMAYFRDNDVEQAKATAEEALKRDPDMPRPRLLLARIYNKTGKQAEAEAILKDMLQAHPDQNSAIVSLAMFYRNHDQNDDAIGLLEAAVERRDDASALWSLLGRLRLDTEDFAGAEAALRKALDLTPRNLTDILPLARALIAQGRVDEADGLVEDLPRTVRQRAVVHRLNGEISSAREDYQRAAEHFRAALLRHKKGEAIITDLDAKIAANGSAQDWQKLATMYRESLDEVREGRDTSGRPKRMRRALKMVMRLRGRSSAESGSSAGEA